MTGKLSVSILQTLIMTWLIWLAINSVSGRPVHMKLSHMLDRLIENLVESCGILKLILFKEWLFQQINVNSFGSLNVPVTNVALEKSSSEHRRASLVEINRSWANGRGLLASRNEGPTTAVVP